MNDAIEIAKTIGIALGELVVTLYVCISYIKKKTKKPNVSKLIPKQNKIDMDIMDHMDYTKEILNADRIHVYEFHNGEHYSDYRSACKFSCSYEVIKAGKKSVRNVCISLPISVMPRFINKITTQGTFYCPHIDEIQNEMPSTFAFKRELGVEAFYDVAIRNEKGDIIGFVAIQWDKGTTPNCNEKEISKLIWFIEDRIREAIKISK